MIVSEKLVSVIVPVFNGETWLNQCVDSILSQTYKFIEIILVDDGSRDRSGVICDEYKRLDNRVKVIHHCKNLGVSSARNSGIDICKGDFIVFIDSDDFVDDNYICLLLEPLTKEDYDLVLCSYLDLDIVTSRRTYHLLSEKELGNLSGDFFKDYYTLRQLLWFPVLKLYKTDIIKKNNICFPNDFTDGEDQFFNFLYFEEVGKYYYINQALYTYCHRFGTSLSKQKTLQSYYSNLKKLKREKLFLKSSHIDQYEMALIDSAFYIMNRYSFLEIDISNQTGYEEFKSRIKEILGIVREELESADKLSLKKRLVRICYKKNAFSPLYIYYLFKNYIKM